MPFFLARRFLYLVPVLIAVSLLTFSIASLLPGDLAYVILGDQATPEKVAALRADMELDQPIWWRYLGWLGNVLQGDFGSPERGSLDQCIPGREGGRRSGRCAVGDRRPPRNRASHGDRQATCSSFVRRTRPGSSTTRSGR